MAGLRGVWGRRFGVFLDYGWSSFLPGSGIRSVGRLVGQAGCCGEDSAVAGVESGAEEKDGGYAADELARSMRLLRGEGRDGGAGSGFRSELAVAEPLFQDLVAAESVVPDVDGDGGPMGVAIEIDIDTGSPSSRARLRG